MRRRRVVAVGVAVLVMAAVGVVLRGSGGPPPRRVVAHFVRTVGIHPGSSVRVLGVRVGEVTAVTPEGGSVRVVMQYDAEWAVPVDVRALIVPPSVVSDRYIQLAPAYAGGPTLADGAELPVGRTVVPLEIDDIYRALDEFNRALGPNGANADGAVTDLVAAGKANLQGNGEDLHAALAGLDRAFATVADGRADLFGTLVNLQAFTTALARSDQQVRAFNQRLAEVAAQLAGERDDLAAALRGLGTALAQVTGFIRDNRDVLRSNVDALADVTGILVRQQKAIIEILDVAPLAVSNLNLAYNPRSGTLDTRDNALGPYDAATYVCAALRDALPAAQLPKECVALGDPKSPGAENKSPAADNKSPADNKSVQAPEVTHDLTLGGILP